MRSCACTGRLYTINTDTTVWHIVQVRETLLTSIDNVTVNNENMLEQMADIVNDLTSVTSEVTDHAQVRDIDLQHRG